MPRPRTKRHILIENAVCLDLRAFKRSGLMVPGEAVDGVLPVFRHLSHSPAGEVYLTCHVHDRERGALTLKFNLRHGWPIEQHVTLVSAARVPYGGRQWYFICPQTGARACRLYLPPDGERFLSREAHGLRYASEHGAQDTNDILRTCRLYARIAGEAPPNGALSPPPPRPKGMHAATYAWLTGRLMCVQARVVGRLGARLGALQLGKQQPCRYSRGGSVGG